MITLFIDYMLTHGSENNMIQMKQIRDDQKFLSSMSPKLWGATVWWFIGLHAKVNDNRFLDKTMD